ncbi:MAG: hypothetical protein L3J23_01805 [Flavobacteriaceae bacterium]|nr:hypothetical protein [Flavobacteriaceae bacterium]
MKTLLILTIFLTTLTSCERNDNDFNPTLPEATQTGKNTFGCYIDGNLLTPRDGTGTTFGPDRGMRFVGSPSNLNFADLKIWDFKSGTGGLLKMHIVDLEEIGTGIFTMQESNCLNGLDANPTINLVCRWWDNDIEAYKWYCSIESTGILNITRNDFENGIISGTFSCQAVNQDNPDDIIEITEGRFDLNWNTLSDTEFP